MADVNGRIISQDPSLFDAVLSQTSPEDRRSLLLIQNWARRSGNYTYLEIGSYLGGTLQPHLLDDRCKLIYSIDKRPLESADESRGTCRYPENSTRRMLDGLRQAFSQTAIEKIRTFDSDASDLNKSDFAIKPDFCFIDGEHINTAVSSDFEFCLVVCNPDGVVAFHDADIIVGGISKVKQRLAKDGIRFEGFVLPNTIYVILFGRAIESLGPELQARSLREVKYMRGVRLVLLKRKLALRYPRIRQVWHGCKRLFNSGQSKPRH